MAHFSTAVVQANEVVKAHDFTHGFDSLINNVSLSLAMALESRQDFVINGMVKPYATGGMNVSVAPIFGLSYATGVPFGDTAMIGPVSISRASEQDRIDIIQIQGAYQEYDEQQREFLDFETKIRTFQSVFTKKRMIVNAVVKSGVPGSVAAPLTDDGFVKLAEIYVPAGTLEITSDNIRNISSDIQGIPNELWTSEKSRTYNIGYISDVNKRYRVQHNADGTHKKNIIGIDQLNAGTESGQVSGINIPTGGEIPINNGKIGATVSLLESLKTLSAKITDFFTVYLQYGALDFKGELSISSIADESNALVNALKIGADGEGTAYLKIGNKTVFTITKDGVMRMATGYAASAKTDLITKAVTDTIASNLESLSDDFEEFKRTTEYTVYSNNLLSRYSIGQTLYAATTAQISLAGLQLIDGVTLSAGVLVLVKNQTDLKQNGIYEVNANNWQRHSSYATAEGIKYTLFPIGNGTQNKGHLFYTPKDTFIINTDEIPFADSIYAIEALPYKLGLRDDGGHLISSAPTAANHTARKAEVDAEATARVNADTNLQNQINTKAPLDNAALTGIPIAPTATAGTNNTQLASTAFVVNEIKRIAYPIGAWVVRYPGMQHPAELYGGTWSKVETDGYFPRFTGGNAAVVNGDVYGALPETVQGDAIRNIVGKFGRGSGPGYFDISSGAFSLAGPSSGIISYGGGYNVPHAVDFNAAYVVPTASENRPYNKTCVLYKKTAL